MVRGFGLDVHRDFCEVAIAENGEVRSVGRVATRLPALELFAGSLVVGDVVAHRVVDAAQRANTWRAEAGQRLTANVAEYLTEERRAFISSRELEELTRRSETLRDDTARLDARLSKIGLSR